MLNELVSEDYKKHPKTEQVLVGKLPTVIHVAYMIPLIIQRVCMAQSEILSVFGIKDWRHEGRESNMTFSPCN